MTKEEEAIKYFQGKIEWAKQKCYPYISKGEVEIFETAIEALEQEPCEDAISRQAVMDKMLELHEKFYTTGKEIRDTINVLPPVTPQPKTDWIPVSERLPEESYAVLIWCPERKNIYCACYENNRWWIFGSYFEEVKLEVIAWMPLPEPYKAESEEV